MAYADQEMSTNRIVALVIVALIHVAIGYALITGLAYSAIEKAIDRVTTVDIEEPPEPEEEPPPPEPVPENSPPPIVAPPPPVSIATNAPQVRTQREIPPPAPVAVRVPPPAPIAAPAPPPPPPPPPSQARGASPRGQNGWARRIQENYPSRALREGTEGDVRVSVVIGTNGRVDSCNVSGSSGDRTLDDAACKGMERYARFNPALNAAGNPTTDNYSTTIRYRLN